MKFKSYLLAAALLLGGAGAAAVGTSVTLAADEPTKVDAYTEGDVYKIQGKLANYPTENWNGAANLILDKETTIGDENPQPALSITLDLAAGDVFKVVNSTTNTWCKTANLGLDFLTLTQDNDQNFQVVTGGTYTITINKHLDTFNDNVSSGYYVTMVTAEAVTVNLVGANGEVARVDETTNNVIYNPAFLFQDGFVNRGWFYDAELTDPYDPVALDAGEITLYGKWEDAGPDLKIYYEGSYTKAYVWNSNGGGDTWPGQDMTKLERSWVSESDVYVFMVPAEYEADRIIFNGVNGQTDDLVLGPVTAVYGDEGVVFDSDDKLAAIDFITAFDELRDDNGDICGILEDSAKYEEVKGLYNTIQDKTLVDSLEDLGAAIKVGDEYEPTTVTIGDTMNYLLVTRGTDVGTGAGLIGSFQKNASDWIAIVSIAVVSVAAAGLFFFIRKRKSAK